MIHIQYSVLRKTDPDLLVTLSMQIYEAYGIYLTIEIVSSSKEGPRVGEKFEQKIIRARSQCTMQECYSEYGAKQTIYGGTDKVKMPIIYGNVRSADTSIPKAIFYGDHISLP